jgi:hypothetical protein
MLQFIHDASRGELGHTTLVLIFLRLSCCRIVQVGEYVLQVSNLQAQ